MYAAAPYMSFCMDVSDGLFREMERVSTINGVGYELLKPLPKEVGRAVKSMSFFGFRGSDLPENNGAVKGYKNQSNGLWQSDKRVI